MSQKQTGSVNIVLILLVVIFAGAAGYFALRKPVVEPSVLPDDAQQTLPEVASPKTDTIGTSPQIPFDETANWKTYRNETFGFYFRYPEGYAMKANTCPQDCPQYMRHPDESGSFVSGLDIVSIEGTEKNSPINVSLSCFDSKEHANIGYEQIWGVEGTTILKTRLGSNELVSVIEPGHYECYECDMSKTIFLTSVCNAEMNTTRDNICLSFRTGMVDKDDATAVTKLKTFFVEQFLANVHISDTFKNLNLSCWVSKG